jgi:hypothetical protein
LTAASHPFQFFPTPAGKKALTSFFYLINLNKKDPINPVKRVLALGATLPARKFFFKKYQLPWKRGYHAADAGG